MTNKEAIDNFWNFWETRDIATLASMRDTFIVAHDSIEYQFEHKPSTDLAIYICFELYGSVENLCKGLILSRLYPCGTVGSWLLYNVPEADAFAKAAHASKSRHDFVKQSNQYRLRWVNAIIEELQAEIDALVAAKSETPETPNA